MRHRLQKMVSASSSIASGHAAYASRKQPSIGGSRTWLPARSYADGSGMTRADGSSSAADNKAELAHKTELLGELRAIAQNNTLTLVFAARDELHNEAIVLRDVLDKLNPSTVD